MPYFTLLRDGTGKPLLAWGPNTEVERAKADGFRVIVLTSEGDMHPGIEDRTGIIPIRCGYLDSGNSEKVAFALAQVNRCAPLAAQYVRRGIPVICTCYRGENRSALMCAKVASLVTGRSGQTIYDQMRAVPRGDGRHTFSNGVFGRIVKGWPASGVASGPSSWDWRKTLGIFGGALVGTIAVWGLMKAAGA